VRHAQQGAAAHLLVLVQGDHNIPYVSGNRRRENPINVHAVDRYGTSHHLNIGFDGQQRVDLRVSTRPGLALFNQAGGTLDFFQVRGLNRDQDNTTCVLYANGHQQTEVAVLVQARNANGEIIKVRDEVLANIEFIDYNTGALLSRSEFTISRSRNHTFDYHPDNNQLRLHSAPGQGSVQSFYISSRKTGNTKIAARLNYGGRTYRTNDRSAPADGAVRNGRSNSSATIQGRAQNYRFSSSQFVVQRENYITRKDLDVDRYAIRFSDPGYFIRASQHERGSEDQTHFGKFNGLRSKRSYSHAAFAVDARSSVRYQWGNWAPTQTHTIEINRPRGTAHAVRVSAVHFTRSNRETKTRVVYLDQYGNGHPVFFGSSEGGNRLTLSDSRY